MNTVLLPLPGCRIDIARNDCATATRRSRTPAQWGSTPSPLSARLPHADPTAPEASGNRATCHNPMCPRHLTPAARSGNVPGGGGARNEISFHQLTNRCHHARSDLNYVLRRTGCCLRRCIGTVWIKSSIHCKNVLPTRTALQA